MCAAARRNGVHAPARRCWSLLLLLVGSLASTFLGGVRMVEWERVGEKHGETRCRVSGSEKREFKLPWREASPPNHHDDTVDSDQ